MMGIRKFAFLGVTCSLFVGLLNLAEGTRGVAQRHRVLEEPDYSYVGDDGEYYETETDLEPDIEMDHPTSKRYPKHTPKHKKGLDEYDSDQPIVLPVDKKYKKGKKGEGEKSSKKSGKKYQTARPPKKEPGHRPPKEPEHHSSDEDGHHVSDEYGHHSLDEHGHTHRPKEHGTRPPKEPKASGKKSGSGKKYYVTHHPVASPTEAPAVYYKSGKKGKEKEKSKYKEGSKKKGSSTKEGKKGEKGEKGEKGGKKGKEKKDKKGHKKSKKFKYSDDYDYVASGSDDQAVRPPVPTPTGPVPSGPPVVYTASPTNEGSFVVPLSQYGLAFTLRNPQMPMRPDLLPLNDLTRAYLEEFMFKEHSGIDVTTLEDFVTRFVTSSYSMGAPIVVEYDSTSRYDPNSEAFPTTRDLDALLEFAFNGDNLLEYQARLGRLPAGNIFRDTVSVRFVQPTLLVSSPPPEQASSSSSSTVIIGSAAAATALLLAGAFIYKRRSTLEDSNGKSLDTAKGDMTVAGDTYAGDTEAGDTYAAETASIDASSLDFSYLNRDEEDGQKTSYLGTIQEYSEESALPAYQGHHEDVNAYGGHEIADHAGRNTDISVVSDSSSHRAVSDNAEDGQHLAQELGRDERNNDSDSLDQSVCSDIASQQAEDMNGTSASSLAQMNASSLQSNSDDATSSSSNTRDIYDGQQAEESKVTFTDSVRSSTSRPRTVSEIESLLSADLNDDDTQHSSTVDGDEFSSSSRRPRTVSEIESLLSADLEEEASQALGKEENHKEDSEQSIS